MNRSPKDLRDLAGLYALDALGPEETAEFEAFCAEHLPHLDQLLWDFFGTEVARDAVRVKVAAMFPEHEVEEFTELFWQRIQQWRVDEPPSST